MSNKNSIFKKLFVAITLCISDALGILQLILTITVYTGEAPIWVLVISYILSAILIGVPMIGMYMLGAMIAYMEFDEVLDEMLHDMENKK